MPMLAIGDAVPDITLRSHQSEEVSLGGFQGKWLVLHTFPLAFTGG